MIERRNVETRQRKFWGWGYEDEGPDESFLNRIRELLKAGLGIEEFDRIEPPKIEDVELRPPRFSLPAEFESFCTSEKPDRLSHCYGKSYRDTIRGLRGRFENPPDYIAYPREEKEIEALRSPDVEAAVPARKLPTTIRAYKSRRRKPTG